MSKQLVTTKIEKIFTKKCIYLNFAPDNHLKNNIVFFNKRWETEKNLTDDFNFVNDLYEHYLIELTKELNKYHNTNHDLRYWRIALGYWLYHFISAIYERWCSINEALRSENEFIFSKAEYNPEKIIPNSINDFIFLTNTQFWNHYVYYQILNNFKDLKKIKFYDQNDNYKELENSKFYSQKKNYFFRQKIKSLFFNNENVENYYFNLKLNIIELLKLNLISNKKFIIPNQFPEYQFISKIYKKVDGESRNNLNLSCKTKNSFEKFINVMIKNNLPRIFFESFNSTKQLLKNFNLPKNPKRIITANGFQTNGLYSLYLAEKIDHSKLVCVQHGGAYGQFDYHFPTLHEIKICDKFLSWGWNSNKVTPFSILKKIDLHTPDDQHKNILFEVRPYRMFVKRIEISESQHRADEQSKKLTKFFSLIKNDNISSDLRIKLSFRDYQDKLDKKNFLNSNPNLKFIDRHKSTLDFKKSTKLIIHTSLLTGHLESFYSNLPLLVFCNTKNLIKTEHGEFIEELKKLKILHDDPLSLHSHLKFIYNDIQDWWNSNEIQEFRLKYCEKFAIVNKNKIKNLDLLIKKSF